MEEIESSGGIERIFVGWDRPFLPEIAQKLISEATPDDGQQLDWSGRIFVLPGARAGRRLLELLVDHCESRNLTLDPPQMITSGRLAESLVTLPHPPTPQIVRHLCWIQALRECEPEQLSVLMKRPPAEANPGSWLPLARRLDSMHSELAGEDRDFESAARILRSGFDQVEESQRWDVLSRLQESFLGKIESGDGCDPDTEKRKHLEGGRIECAREILLLATADLPGILKRLLALTDTRIRAFVHAPESMHERFDEWGCVIAPAWAEAEIPLDEDSIHLAERPRDEAPLVLQCLEELGGKTAPEDISIGINDVAQLSDLERTLQAHSIEVHSAWGRDIRSLPLHLLLDACREHLAEDSFQSLSTLLRSPDVEDLFLRKHPQWQDQLPLSMLDRYQQKHLPGPGASILTGQSIHKQAVADMHAFLEELLSPLKGPRRSLSEWPAFLQELIRDLLENRSVRRNDPAAQDILEYLDHLQAICLDLSHIPPEMDLKVKGVQALDFLLQHLSMLELHRGPASQGIDLLGWLELPLDDAPVLVITGMLEGNVPSATLGDLFLPDSLRQQLDLMDNHRRHGRDAYALAAMISGREVYRLLTCRTHGDGQPALPSRLLMTGRSSAVAERICRLLDDEKGKASRKYGFFETQGDSSLLSVPRQLITDKVPEPLAVTAFRAYLASPFRFCLRYVFELESEDDEATELGPPQFGNLAHEVLTDWGKGRLADSTDPMEISRELISILELRSRRQYGDQPHPAVQIQLQQLAGRLRRFAGWQAERAREGWRIEACELKIPLEKSHLEVDGKTFALKGRIDRIDRHRDGRWMILDYKTGNNAKDPQKAHRKKDAWIDLQLPLYRILMEESDQPSPELGYIHLCADPDAAVLDLAGWDTDMIDSARKTAEDIIREIRRGVYPNDGNIPHYSDGLEAICQDEQFREMVDEEGGES